MTQAYCDSILGLCVAANDWDSVPQVMEIMRDQKMAQEHSTYRACLQSCFEIGNGLVAQQILEAMRTTCIEPDALDIALVVVTMCRNEKNQAGSYRKALQLLRTTAATVEKKEVP